MGPLYSYAFDRRSVDGILEAANGGSFELAAKMDQEWADVARRIGVRRAMDQLWTEYDSGIGSICLYYS